MKKNNITNYWLLGINDFNGKFQLCVVELRGQFYPNLGDDGDEAY
ncbi:unnamed protein product, partial [Rotaria sp. Silwood2]